MNLHEHEQSAVKLLQNHLWIVNFYLKLTLKLNAVEATFYYFMSKKPQKQNSPSLIAYGNGNGNLRSNSRWTIETVNESVVSIYPVNKRLCIAWVKAQIHGVRWNQLCSCCQKIQIVEKIKPSKPAVKRTRSANSLVRCKNSCKPGRSKTVTRFTLCLPSASCKPWSITSCKSLLRIILKKQ